MCIIGQTLHIKETKEKDDLINKTYTKTRPIFEKQKQKVECPAYFSSHTAFREINFQDNGYKNLDLAKHRKLLSLIKIELLKKGGTTHSKHWHRPPIEI